MPTFFVHLEFGGVYPREWKDTPFEVVNNTAMVKVGAKGVEQKVHRSETEAAFAVQLKNLVTAMFTATLPFQNHFTNVYVTTYPDRNSIGNRDLLCYVRESRRNSLLSTDDRNELADGASGVTQRTPDGIISEVWLNE